MTVLAFALSSVASAAPVISEFMASNTSTLKDGHENREDWIEIWNPDPVPVNLQGWRLTDAVGNSSKFVFPSKVLPAGARMVVFASNRGNSTGANTHVDPLGFLHTNFALAKSGEYLALISPGGVVSTAFAPNFPAQIDDVSYGQPAANEELVNQATPVRYKVPTTAADDTASPNWRAANFSDTSWTAGAGGVGFEAGTAVGLWPLDESAGATTAVDASGSGLNAAPTGSGQTFGQTGAGGGTNTALSLTGSGGLTVPYSVKLNPANSFTFAAWVHPTTYHGNHQAVVSSRVGPANQQRGYILYLAPNGGTYRWEFWTGNSTGSSGGWNVVSGPNVAFNTWTHVAITRDTAGNKRLYINGTQVAAANQAYLPNNNPANGFHLGCGDDTGGNFRFIGRIDDAAFFPSDIGAALVAQHLTTGAGSFPTPLYPAHYQTDVQGSMLGVQSGVYTRRAFAIVDRTRYVSLRLRMKYDDGFVAYLNGTEIARRNFTGTRVFNAVADSDRADTDAVVFADIDVTAEAQPVLVNGANTLAIHGLTRSTSHLDFLLAPTFDAGLTPAAQTPGYFTAATPGTANVLSTVTPGPAIGAVSHTPAEPLPGQAIVVTAHLTPRLAPIGSASLKYRVMYGAESAAIPMSDGGPVPGATDGSRIYTGTIPGTHGAAARQMLRFSVTATDTAARTWRDPYPVDLSNDNGVSQSPEYHGLAIKDAALTAGMPIMQWFTNDVPNSDTRVGSRGSVWFGGKFYDNMYIRQRGGFTSSGSQKFNFNAGDGVFVNDTLGTVGEVNMNSSGADGNYYRVAASYDLYRTSGHPACEAFTVAMYRNGSYHRMATLIEQVDEDFVDRRGYDPDGALYKFVQRLGETPLAGGDYSNSPAFGDTLYGIEKKTRLTESWSDLEAVVAGLTTGTAAEKNAYLFKNLNLPNFVNFMAMRALLAENDVNRKNFYFYRDSDDAREWYLFPWDKDMTMGIGYSASESSYRANPWQSTDTFKHDPAGTRQWCVLWEQGYQSVEIRAMVGRRLRTLMDGMMGAPGVPAGTTLMEQRMTAVRATMTPLPPGVSIGSYNDLTSWNNWLGQHRNALFTTYGPSSGYGMIPAVASGAPNVVIESADSNPAAGTQDLEQMRIVNQGADAVDMTGWTLNGGGINHTFKSGTVLVGTATSATLNRAHVCNNRAAWRARPGAPATAEYVLGNYDGALTARGGTVELRNASGTLISSLALPVAPTAGQQQLRVTELMFAPPAPTLDELSAQPGLEAGDFEYLELQNIGAANLTLTNFRFTDGVDFTFGALALAPSERLIVCRHPAAFDLRYGAGKNRIGPWTGALDNAGERLRLVDDVGEEIFDFTYDPRWFPPADTGGRSIVVRAATPDYAGYGSPAQWALSQNAGGTPGTGDTGFANVMEAWRWDFWSAGQIYLPSPPNPENTVNSSLVGLLADADSDLRSNFEEYAFGGNPVAADHGAPFAVASVVNVAGTDYLAVTFHRRVNALDLTYVVEAASNLSGPWSPVSTLVTAIPSGFGLEQVTIRDQQPRNGSPRFLRARATKL